MANPPALKRGDVALRVPSQASNPAVHVDAPFLAYINPPAANPFDFVIATPFLWLERRYVKDYTLRDKVMPSNLNHSCTYTVVRWLHPVGEVVDETTPLLEFQTEDGPYTLANGDGTLVAQYVKPGQVVRPKTALGTWQHKRDSEREHVLYGYWGVGAARFVVHLLLWIVLYSFFVFPMLDWIGEHVFYALFEKLGIYRSGWWWGGYDGVYPAISVAVWILGFIILVPQPRYFSQAMFAHALQTVRKYDAFRYHEKGKAPWFKSTGRPAPVPAPVPLLSPEEQRRMEYEKTVASHTVHLSQLAAEKERHLAEVRKYSQEHQPPPPVPTKPRPKSVEEKIDELMSMHDRFAQHLRSQTSGSITPEEKDRIIQENKRQVFEQINELSMR